MKSTLLGGAIIAIAWTTTLSAQDFEFDDSSLDFEEEIVFDDSALDFDESALEFDDDAFEFDETAEFEDDNLDTFSQEPRSGPSFQLTASASATTISSVTTNNSSFSLIAKDNNQLGQIGFLDWQVSVRTDTSGASPSSSFNIDKLILQNSTETLSWQVGKFPIGWGEVEGTPVLDVLNGGLSLADLGTATEDLPGQWFATVDYFAGASTISGFVALDPEVSHALPNATTGAETEFGARFSLPFEGGQANLYAARLLPQAGVVSATGTSSSAQPYTLIGLSAHRAFDSVLLEFDLAAKQGLERASAGGFIARDRLDAAIGFEYAVSNKTQFNGSISAQHWLDASGTFFDFGSAGPAASTQTSSNYQFSLSTTAAKDKLSLTAFAGGATDGSAQFGALQAKWTPNDSFSLSASASQVSANPGSLLSGLDGLQSVSIEAGYFF